MDYEHCLLVANIVMASAMVASAIIMLVAECRRNKQEKLKPKRDVLRRLVAHTYRLTESLKGQDREPFAALNEAKVVFADSGDVMAALRNILEHKGHLSENIRKLIKAMASEVGYPADSISGEMLERPFTPPAS